MFRSSGSNTVQFLRAYDAGLLRLRQAAKTLLVVVIALGIFWRADGQTRMFAAAGSAYIMQCTAGGSRRRKQLTMLIAGLAMAAIVALGGGLHGHSWAQDAVIVATAAAAYYFRRFLPDRGQFPIFGFILCVLAVVLSTGPKQAWHDALAVSAGVPLAFAIYFFVLPPDPACAARDHRCDFRRRLDRLLHADRSRALLSASQFATIASRPAALQRILDYYPDHPDAARLRETVDDEYALLESLLVLSASGPAPRTAIPDSDQAVRDTHPAPSTFDVAALVAGQPLGEVNSPLDS